MQNHILFLTLKIFSATGGIEKVSRIAGRALFELCNENGCTLDVYSMYDETGQVEEKYFPAAVFRGFGGRRTAFVLKSIQQGRGAGLVILSHVNLLSVGFAIKRLSPETKLVLLAHGIEVWQSFPAWKRHMLHSFDKVLPVSAFTRQKMQELYGLPAAKLQVLNNCLDPFLPKPAATGKSESLLKKYGLSPEHKVLLTLTRLSDKDGYKGYDDVIMALKALKSSYPHLRYMLIGKYEEAEKGRLDRLIRQQGLEGEVIFTGYVPDEKLADYFSLADIYIMPSRKEGFGIVFIEAMYYGKPVIAGSVDGSVDALANGTLGALVDPDDPAGIRATLELFLRNEKDWTPSHTEVLRRFGFPVYKKALWQAIRSFLQPGEKQNETTKTERHEAAPIPCITEPL